MNEWVDIFKKVAVSGKKQVLREAAAQECMLSIKSEEDVIVQTPMIWMDQDYSLFCRALSLEDLIRMNGRVTCNFTHENERYFFQTDLEMEGDEVRLNCAEVDLYQLQRRKNTRLFFPENYDAGFNITEYKGKSYFIFAKIKDISAGGCKVIIPKQDPAFVVGSQFSGFLRVGHRKPLPLVAEVRHVLEETKDNAQVFGVQFVEINSVIENRLLSMMVDIQRELYVRFGTAKPGAKSL